QHNLNYWRFGDYLAIGAGAHGKITHPNGDIWRYQKTRLPQHYLAEGGHLRRQLEPITRKDRPFEFMLNALRLTQGVPSHLFTTTTGMPLSTIAEPWQRLRQQQLMVDSDRSEEHTSELQSRFDLVCRLLLEIKNTRSKEHKY